MNKKGQIQSGFIIPVFAIGLMFICGILAGITVYSMDTFKTAIETIDINLTRFNNANITSFQDIAEMTFYPLLNLRDSVVYISYFLIFGLVISMGMFAFSS